MFHLYLSCCRALGVQPQAEPPEAVAYYLHQLMQPGCHRPRVMQALAVAIRGSA